MEIFNEKYIPQNTLRDFFAVLFKHRNKTTMFILTILATVVIGTLLAPREYESEAKLFVRLGRETVHTNSAAGETIQISQSMENQLNSELEILRSRELAEKVVSDMGRQSFQKTGAGSTGSFLGGLLGKIKAVLSIPKLAVARFLSNPSDAADIERRETEAIIYGVIDSLEAQVAADSNVISLTYGADNPLMAHDILNRLIRIYMDRHIELRGNPGSFQFFEKESEKLRHELEAAESELKEAKNLIGVGNLEEQRSILAEQIGNLQREREEAESGIASSEALMNALQAKLSNMPEQVVVSETSGFAQSAMQDMQRRIYELKLQEQELLSTFTENSIPVSEVRRQIREAEGLQANATGSHQVTRGVNQTHQNLNVSMMLESGQLESLKARKTSIDAQIASGAEKLRRFNDAEVGLVKLHRKKDLLEQNYKKYAESLEQMRIDQAREVEKISNISIAQAPTVPIDPVRPKTMLNLVLGMFLALFGGLGLAFFMEYIDDKLETPERIERVLELPVLGSVKRLEN